MHKTSLKQLGKCLKKLNIPRSSIIVIHSSLLKFGIIEKGIEGFYQCILDSLNGEPTILMPAFSFAFAKTRVWSANSTKSETGVLSEYFRNLPDTGRTIHPFHSMCVQGKYANVFLECTNVSSFGPGSPFEILYDMNAYNLSLGTEFIGGATFVHHTEEECQVPYRFYKEFPGNVYDENNKKINKVFKMYVREITAEYEYENDWDKVFKDLCKEGCFQVDILNGAKIMSSNIKYTHDVFKRNIMSDMYYASKITYKE